ncbi:hypothetical protein Ddye_006201 [Dipteronia dyeriana]|uniref:Bifunctional inhibitor/plant lipid transfer protein/seed storage helical domain-containing protein n=1 Tax=Dipteronia dyeriana TaxID=168575 RepID=A0AAE0CQY7_9ROSI|nr:hypothetical protein Ddye_006201 [Dipteronia dyeriana]
MTTRILLIVVCVMAVANSAASRSKLPPSHSPSPVPVPAPSHSSSSPPVPAPSPSDCSNVIYNMASCLSFLGNDSNVTKPDSACCDGFKSVLHAGFECICTAVSSSAQMGLDLNMTKAYTLPAACGVSVPSLNNCNNAKPPAKPPVSPVAPVSPSQPSTPAKPPKANTPAPSQGDGTPELAPSPSTVSGSYSMSASLTFIIISMLVASFSLVTA